MFIAVAAANTQPFLIGQAIDKFIDRGDRSGLDRVGIALVALAIVSWAGQYVQQVATAFMGHRMLLSLRNQMFSHIQRLSLSFIDRNEVGRIMSRVQNDVTVLQELLSSGFLTILVRFCGLRFGYLLPHLYGPHPGARHFQCCAGAGDHYGDLATLCTRRLQPRPFRSGGRQLQPARERVRRARNPEPLARG